MAKKGKAAKRPTVFTIKVYGEGLTEWHYFDKIRTLEKFVFTLEPGMPENSRSSYKKRLLQISKELKRPPQERASMIILVTDLDNIVSSPSELRAYLDAKAKYEAEGVIFIESHPSIELWFLYHFRKKYEKTAYPSYDAIKSDLRAHLPGYDKAGKYYSSNTTFRDCIVNSYGNRKQAAACAYSSCGYEPVEGEVCNSTNLHKLIIFLHMLQFTYTLSDLLRAKVPLKFSLQLKVSGLDKIEASVLGNHLFMIAAEKDKFIWHCPNGSMEIPLGFRYDNCDEDCKKMVEDTANLIKSFLE
ncbi:MAG: RloB family protein [Muribaculaceae bacterium]|nr:RloB family protein [Muribaculaceae bacterium]